jgi:serine protease Do
MNQFFETITGRVVRRARIIAVITMMGAAVLTGACKEAPKLSIAERELDRSVPGASYSAVIKQVTPSVVTVQSTRTVEVRQFRHPFLDDPTLRRFFGPEYDSRSRGSDRMREEGLGSGVIVTEDGYILTNNHVVDGADDDGIKVLLADGRTRYDAKLIGRDPRTDVAVLKVEAPAKLPALTLGDSEKLEVGDVVLAVGNPFGIGQSVSAGIISALSRGFGILGRQGYEDFIQTDASINKGNSGGALVDAEGRLIGINQSIASPSGANAGVGFAIPINLVRSVMEQLVVHGRITRGYLGVNLQPLTPGLAEAFKLPDTQGALIGAVESNTPAAKAGMRAGDVIIEFNGRKVSDYSQLRIMVAQTPPKTKVTFKALRDGRERTFEVTLAELPESLAAGRMVPEDESAITGSRALRGVELTDLTNQLRRRHDIPNTIRGALVTRVEADSPAAEAGLRVGDVIVEVNRQATRNLDEVENAADEVRGRRLLLRVYSSDGEMGATRFLSVEIGRP